MATSIQTTKCTGQCATCRSTREPDLPDIHHLGPVGIVRAEMLAAVDELMETFRTRG